jgi:hypothetical protein
MKIFVCRLQQVRIVEMTYGLKWHCYHLICGSEMTCCNGNTCKALYMKLFWCLNKKHLIKNLRSTAERKTLLLLVLFLFAIYPSLPVHLEWAQRSNLSCEFRIPNWEIKAKWTACAKTLKLYISVLGSHKGSFCFTDVSEQIIGFMVGRKKMHSELSHLPKEAWVWDCIYARGRWFPVTARI